ncbi:MAG: mannitol dehydrogenase family protein [Lachnospiraceae bacterium]|nr:mannitol dehydrogenase family protein [Lachnospiraceae bacterium]
MRLSLKSISEEKQNWIEAGVALPSYDVEAVRKNTRENPCWVHFGAGNIFRDFIAGLADKLIGDGKMDSGITAVEVFDPEMIDLVYEPYDSLTLSVGLQCDGKTRLRVKAGIGEAVKAASDPGRLMEIAAKHSLQMVSYTITEKGYVVKDSVGEPVGYMKVDIEGGPGRAASTIGLSTAMLYQRYKAGKAPVAFVSMDNCSGNGDRLKEAVCFVAEKWIEKGLAEAGFMEYLQDEKLVAFPCSMIDKITPRPDQGIADKLKALGIEGMEVFVTGKNTYISPFVNAEIPQYLVVEDKFPAGRPPLQEAGVYMTKRDTVEKSERMKVQSCLNPLHTGLAVCGCLLGFNKISEEMKDEDLKALAYGLGKEGLEVVCDPGIIKPSDFIKEVLEERLPNPYMPDTPQRIACDTSQKIPIRFGHTMKSYAELNREGELELIPFVIAAWFRYLSGYDDRLEKMQLSPDPELDALCSKLASLVPGKGVTDISLIEGLLSDSRFFAMDLTKSEALSGKIKEYYKKMMSGKGAVREALHEAVNK